MKEFMKKALLEAKKAYDEGEVPVGCVVVYEGKIISSAHNASQNQKDPTLHAEIIALREALLKVDKYEMRKASLYVTMEPCPMCMGAITLFGVEKVVFGAYDYEWGAALTRFDVRRGKDAPEIIGGIMERECEKLLKDYFSNLRSIQKK